MLPELHVVAWVDRCLHASFTVLVGPHIQLGYGETTCAPYAPSKPLECAGCLWSRRQLVKIQSSL